MRITEHLGITPEQFFDVMDRALLADIAEARGKKKAKPSNLHEGFSYRKHLRGKEGDAYAATVRIVAYDRPRAYRSTVTTSQGVNTMSYEVEPCADGGIDVTYEETFEADGALARVLGALRGAANRGRVKSRLHAMEVQVRAARLAEGEEGEAGGR